MDVISSFHLNEFYSVQLDYVHPEGVISSRVAGFRRAAAPQRRIAAGDVACSLPLRKRRETALCLYAVLAPVAPQLGDEAHLWMNFAKQARFAGRCPVVNSLEISQGPTCVNRFLRFSVNQRKLTCITLLVAAQMCAQQR